MSRNQNLQVEMDLRRSCGQRSGSYHPDRAMSVETQASDTSPSNAQHKGEGQRIPVGRAGESDGGRVRDTDPQPRDRDTALDLRAPTITVYQ